MEIGWPTDVRHIAHVTFDRFNGFLGLPVELELEVPRRVPSASVSVFGVSAESMQCSYDGRGNSVPTILLLLQERLYGQGGLQAEGIFRINPENSQEEDVRDQLNKGIVPYDIDVHCLAGLIKAWFRELPKGVLDSLTPDQVMQCNTEEQCVELVKKLPPTEAGLLNWAINLMADVVQKEEHNKMNARNIAMVFAPNMTQMSDPLTALMHAVQVMNFLKTLIIKTVREREEATPPALLCDGPTDNDGHESSTQNEASFPPLEESSVNIPESDVQTSPQLHMNMVEDGQGSPQSQTGLSDTSSTRTVDGQDSSPSLQTGLLFGGSSRRTRKKSMKSQSSEQSKDSDISIKSSGSQDGSSGRHDKVEDGAVESSTLDTNAENEKTSLLSNPGTPDNINNKDGELAVTIAGVLPFFGRMQNGVQKYKAGRRACESNSPYNKGFVQCAMYKSIPSKVKPKDGQMPAKLDFPNESVEAWENSDNMGCVNNNNLEDNNNEKRFHASGKENVDDCDAPKDAKSNPVIKTTIGFEMKRTRKQVRRHMLYNRSEELEDKQDSIWLSEVDKPKDC